MIYRIFLCCLLLGGLASCDSGPADTTTETDGRNVVSTPPNTDRDNNGGLDWEDQSARSSVTANSANYDGSPNNRYRDGKAPDSLEYIQTPETFSVSPVGDNPRPNQNHRKDDHDGSIYGPK